MLTLNKINVDKGLENEVATADRDQFKFDGGEAGSRQIAAAKYHSKRGTITIIRKDGQQFDIGGLPTPAMFGTGKPGDRGGRGTDGRPGRNGRPGPTGATGCPGETGPRGLTGPTGEPGQDGPDGYQGEDGFAGAIGPTGDKGEDGLKGVRGPDGNPGPSCIAGAMGPTGPAPIERFVSSQTKPTDPAIRLWAFDTDSNNPSPLPDVPDLQISVSDLVLTALRSEAKSSWYHAVAWPEVRIVGGHGPFAFKWELIDSHLHENMSLESHGISARFAFRDQVQVGKEFDETVKIRVTVTDNGTASKTTLTRVASIRVIARNGGAHQCLVFGTLVETPSGFKPAEQIRVGDKIAAFTGQPRNIEEWRAAEINGSKMWATVIRANTGTADLYIEVSGSSRLTPEHPVLANVGGPWRYVRAVDLTNSSDIWTENGAERATVRTIAKTVDTVDIQIDLLHAFFAGNILVHNMDDSGYETKRKY